MHNYFPHDSNARNDEKLIRLRMQHKSAGYGVYFMILERMREENDYMCAKDYNLIAFDLREDAALVKSVVENYGLFEFTEDNKFFYSKSFLERMGKRESISKTRAEAGRRGGEATANSRKQTSTNTDTQAPPCDTSDADAVPPCETPKPATKGKTKLTYSDFEGWLQKNAPELTRMRPPSEDGWTEIKCLYGTLRRLEQACLEIAANEPFRKKWKYFTVALKKWKEHEQRLNPQKARLEEEAIQRELERKAWEKEYEKRVAEAVPPPTTKTKQVSPVTDNSHH